MECRIGTEKRQFGPEDDEVELLGGKIIIDNRRLESPPDQKSFQMDLVAQFTR